MSESTGALPSFGGNAPSLAQSAREAQLRTARNIMIFIGALTIIANVVVLFLIDAQADAFIDSLLQESNMTRADADPDELARVKREVVTGGRLIAAGALVLGVVYLVFAAYVKRYPVPITITALVLYIAAAGIFGLLDPATLLQGIVIKVIIIIALAKAISAALAYEKGRRETSGAA